MRLSRKVTIFLVGVALLLPACGGDGGGSRSGTPVTPGTPGAPDTPGLPLTSLLPFLAGDGTVQLLDPLVAPKAGNPLTVDTNVEPMPAGVICDNCLARSAVFFAGSRDGDVVTGLRAARLAYVRRGSGNDTGAAVFRVNLDQGAVHTPLQLSVLDDVCGLVPSETLDWADVDNTAIVVERAGIDGSCAGTSDNVTAVIRLNSAATDTGVAMALLPGPRNRLHARTDATGAVVGYVSLEVTGPAGAALVRRDAALSNPVTLLDLGETLGANLERADATRLFVTVTPVDQSLQLRRIEADGSLSDTLYSFIGFNARNPIQDGVHSATHLFFSDENRLMRLPLGASSVDASANVLTTLPCLDSASCLRVENRAYDASTDRVVFEAQDDNITIAGGVFSAAATAADAAATPLANNPEPSGLGGYAVLHRLAAGRAYINVAYHGTPERSTDAILARADGSAAADNYPSAYWAGSTLASTVDLDGAGGLPPPDMLYLARRDSTTSIDTLSTFDPDTVIEGIVIGSVEQAAVFLAIDVSGIGAVALARVQKDREGLLDYDVHTADTAAPLLGPLSLTAGVNDLPLDGHRRATGNLCLLCL